MNIEEETNMLSMWIFVFVTLPSFITTLFAEGNGRVTLSRESLAVFVLSAVIGLWIMLTKDFNRKEKTPQGTLL